MEIVKGSFVTVNVTGDSGIVEDFDHDGTSGADFACVRLDHSRRLATIPLDGVTLDPAYAERNIHRAQDESALRSLNEDAEEGGDYSAGLSRLRHAAVEKDGDTWEQACRRFP